MRSIVETALLNVGIRSLMSTRRGMSIARGAVERIGMTTDFDDRGRRSDCRVGNDVGRINHSVMGAVDLSSRYESEWRRVAAWKTVGSNTERVLRRVESSER